MNKTKIIEAARRKEQRSEVLRGRYKEKREELFAAEKEWKKANEEKREAIQKLDEFAEFKVGDKVEVEKAINEGSLFSPNWVNAMGFISKIIVSLKKDNTIEYTYKVNAMKQSGEPSKKALRQKRDTYSATQLKKQHVKL